MLFRSGNKTLGAMLNLKSIDWKTLSNAKSAGEVLVLVYNYLAKTVLQSETVMGAVNGLAPEIGNPFKTGCRPTLHGT